MSDPIATPSPSTPAKRWWRDGMIWLVVGIIVMVVGGNAVMISIAVQGRPSLVRRDYYEASKQVDADKAAREASAELGWRVQAGTDNRAPDTLRVRITDPQGNLVEGLTGQARAYRPSDAGMDQPLTWQADPAAPGEYRAVFARPHAGRWRITLDLAVQGRRLYQDLSVVLPAP